MKKIAKFDTFEKSILKVVNHTSCHTWLTGMAQWYHLAILGLENSYTSGEATSIGI